MSNEQQQYSPENQLEIIRQYAAAHTECKIVKSLVEIRLPPKSRLSRSNRPSVSASAI